VFFESLWRGLKNSQQVTLASEERVPFDKLLLATGAEPIPTKERLAHGC
jgi:NADPH-dependent 2,4-dienoyl-CoA reductase/sulfur reductase-like enzyme